MSKLLVTLLAVLVAAFAVAGCGGQKVTADEVPGAPVALQIPEVTKGGSDALAGKSGTTGTTQSGSTGGTSGTTQQQTQQGNGTSGQSQGSGNTFDDFCKNN